MTQQQPNELGRQLAQKFGIFNYGDQILLTPKFRGLFTLVFRKILKRPSILIECFHILVKQSDRKDYSCANLLFTFATLFLGRAMLKNYLPKLDLDQSYALTLEIANWLACRAGCHQCPNLYKPRPNPEEVLLNFTSQCPFRDFSKLESIRDAFKGYG